MSFQKPFWGIAALAVGAFLFMTLQPASAGREAENILSGVVAIGADEKSGDKDPKREGPNGIFFDEATQQWKQVYYGRMPVERGGKTVSRRVKVTKCFILHETKNSRHFQPTACYRESKKDKD